MPRKNYKLIAKKQLEKLNNDYEELKIKSQDPYYECDEYICNIADLERWLEDNGDYRVRYKDYPDLRDTRNIFKDLNIIDENIEHKFQQIEFLKNQIQDLKIEKTNILKEDLKLENNQINKIKFTNIPMNRKEIEFFQAKIRAIRKNKNWEYFPQ
jgi:regulator of replication initiation timing